jgi:hypothetical protein
MQPNPPGECSPLLDRDRSRSSRTGLLLKPLFWWPGSAVPCAAGWHIRREDFVHPLMCFEDTQQQIVFTRELFIGAHTGIPGRPVPTAIPCRCSCRIHVPSRRPPGPRDSQTPAHRCRAIKGNDPAEFSPTCRSASQRLTPGLYSGRLRSASCSTPEWSRSKVHGDEHGSVDVRLAAASTLERTLAFDGRQGLLQHPGRKAISISG